MDVNIICPECHSKMVYRGGNVMVTLTPDEIGKIQSVEASHCEKCGKLQAAFYFQIDLNKDGQQ